MKFDKDGRLIVPEVTKENFNKEELKSANIVEMNSLSAELSEKILKEIPELKFRDEKTMRCFEIESEMGLCWIQPLKNGGAIIYLRKKDYSSIDQKDIVKYSTPQSRTYGDYPLIKIYHFGELDYALELIKWAYMQDRR